MGLDMYAYKMPLEAMEGWLLVHGDPVGNETWADFNPRKVARELTGFKHMTDEELSKLRQDERDWYWDRLRLADGQAYKQGLIDNNYHYWRKFNALHGWMEDLWRSRMGPAFNKEYFNCRTLRLSTDDLLRLKKDKNNLTPRGGFFFGSTEIYPEDLTSLETFLDKALVDVDNNAIFYDSWW